MIPDFRAYDPTLKKWIKVMSIQFLDGDICIGDGQYGYTIYSKLVPISGINTILMQFTGILDKNGRKIYEGDLLKTRYDRIVEVKWYENLGYDGGGGAHSGFYYQEDLDYYTNLDELEIVGNKFDNPVLIQKELKYDEEN